MATRSQSVESDVLPRLTRLFKILTLLSSRSPQELIGRKELADACGASVRTVQRDLDLLTDGQMAPIEYDSSRRTYKIAVRGWTFPVASWTPEDALALTLARGRFPSTLPHADLVNHALDKIAAQLSPRLRDLLQACSAVLQTPPEARDYSRAPITALMNAAMQRETVEVDYESRSSGRGLRFLDPYAVEETPEGIWQVHGWCHRNRRILSFALDRIRSVSFTGAIFERRETEWKAFSHEAGVIGGLRGEETPVELLFSAEAAHYVLRSTWPEGVIVTQQPDGSVRLVGAVSGTAGILPEILRWRRHCRVLGGEALRRAVVEEIEAMGRLYIQ
jgi:predicted DNA-binding transcriptional regulator YafY